MSLVMQAKLHQARNEMREAAHYFRMNLERIEAENITGSDQLDALIYLAEYAKVTGGNLPKYMQAVADVPVLSSCSILIHIGSLTVSAVSQHELQTAENCCQH